jgi:protein tyrosine/serine phosphatase
VFRSDSLHAIDDADADAFAELGVRTVIDLRRGFEIDRFGRVPHHDGLDYRHYPIEHLDWGEVPYPDGTVKERWLADRYLDFTEQGTVGLAATLSALADPERVPAVVHCMAGKDRTGVVCALTLSLLGVADSDIAADYALSNPAMAALTAYVREKNPDSDNQPHYYDCPEDAMSTFLADLRQRHGSVEGYVRHIGLSAGQVATLRDHLLE